MREFLLFFAVMTAIWNNVIELSETHKLANVFRDGMMKLEIKNIFSPDLAENRLPDDLQNFKVLLSVSIGEKDKTGEELFYFTVASFLGIQSEVKDSEFKFLHGYILLESFDWKVVHRTIENLINHSRHLQNWSEIIEYWSRYGKYGS